MIKTAFTQEDAERIVAQYTVTKEPFYKPQGEELELLEKAESEGMGVGILGPTGSGKTRLLEYFAWKKKRPHITISGNESVDAMKVTGNVLILGGEAQFVPGPAYRAVRTGAHLYFDELLEMNEDVIPVCFPLTDWRRRIEVEDTGEVANAEEGFFFTFSTNPGKQYRRQGKTSDLPPSFLQRCILLDLGYIRGPRGVEIIVKESGIEEKIAVQLDNLAQKVDKMFESQEYSGRLQESVGYHALIKAAKLIRRGEHPHTACHHSITLPLSPRRLEVRKAIDEIIRDIIIAR
ncbi:AAA family ATPase [Candidatus Woesearchaeota archaeon]|nr:AAA family ATPase [Candidatus Woesearchaeota archaeon]